MLSVPPNRFAASLVSRNGARAVSTRRFSDRAVQSGDMHVQRDSAASDAPAPLLSPRETQVLSLVAQGHPNKQIGWRLGLSEETVKSNIKSILRKLDVRDRTHAVAKAAVLGLIDI